MKHILLTAHTLSQLIDDVDQFLAGCHFSIFSSSLMVSTTSALFDLVLVFRHLISINVSIYVKLRMEERK